ncbi:hypothetical protein AB3X52_07450 [Nocardioides sp. DS6]|uniref:Transposase n=1 Tax=Nocardioides eburneus TaxID=3231482 RepID=A0ABV3SWX6_9ACTN
MSTPGDGAPGDGTPGDGADGVLAIAEELYGLPLGDFTPARDARARELKGDPRQAAVKGLRKPSTAAWVVDLLVRYETEQVDQVLAVGAALREAQQGMDAAALRELTRQRRQLTAAVTTRARALARSHGLRVTDAVAVQVEATLTAAMVDPGAAQAVRSGLLVSALSATGVGAVDAAAAVALPEALGFEASALAEPPPVPLHAVPDLPDTRALDGAREALAEAEAAEREARAERDRAQEEVDRLRARALQASSELDELRRRLAELEEDAQETDDALADAEDTRDTAEESLARAEESLDVAQKSVVRLERSLNEE